ncbi:hypothetical protein O3G_MSEX000727 [Manduca sexta]|nr:hypothetical protein O3G_MSEX000727 [Manduca sexta]
MKLTFLVPDIAAFLIVGLVKWLEVRQMRVKPSPASMMVASTIVTDEGSTEELQKRFAEILDENVILKSSLQQNNDSMKQQFMLIKSCQEDMMKTHLMHKEKFEETKELIERVSIMIFQSYSYHDTSFCSQFRQLENFSR